MADMTVEILTSRAISPQILRHKSFSFQEFSQRYAEVNEFEDVELRLQGDSKQGSGDVFNDIDIEQELSALLHRSDRIYKL
jgi:thymidylate synthase (FAD)